MVLLGAFFKDDILKFLVITLDIRTIITGLNTTLKGYYNATTGTEVAVPKFLLLVTSYSSSMLAVTTKTPI